MGIFRPRYDGAKPGMESYHPTRWLAAALIERMCGSSGSGIRTTSSG
ncbi:hypothetical protein MPTA5024_13500 [Microbispora sp. ATCC PTA-5024]|nr:hypothetical protein MPTA5024_13500 [Microbispora sp. ATCC PTA-5024]